MNKSSWLRAAIAGVVVLLSACGGGGGGGGGGGVSVSADKSSLSFLGFAGQSTELQQTINLTLHGGDGTYFGALKADRSDVLTATFNPTSTTTATLTIAPTGNFGGSLSGNITLMLCKDSACQNVAWSQAIPYTLEMYYFDTSSITMTGYEGAAGTSSVVNIVPSDTAHKLTFKANSGSAGSWLSTVRNSDSQISVNSAANGITSGYYAGSVDVSLAGTSSIRSIPVSFTVGIGIVAPAARSLDLTLNTTGASLSGNDNISFQGAQSPNWTAVSDKPWLKLTNAAGTGPGALSSTIDTTKLDTVPNWSSDTATVTISAVGMSQVSYQVTINKKLPEVFMVAPNPVVAGQATTAHIYGKGFSQLTGGSQFAIPAAAGSTVTVASDTEAYMTVPALAAGDVAVSIPNAAGVAVSTSSMQVVNRTTLGYATVPNTGEKRWAIYDPTRTAVYAVNVTQNTLVRYQLSGGAWHVDQLPIASIGDLAFAPDRKSLIVGSGVSELYAVDPDTLTPQLLASYTLGGFAPAYGIAPSLLSTKGMVITNDARLWIQSVGLYFDISTKTFNSLPVSSPNVRAGFGAPSYYASADGSTMLEVSNGSYPEPPVVRYSAATGKEVLANLPNSSIFLLSQDGSKVLDEYGSLYRVSDQTVLGKVNLSLSGRVAVLSPDGNRAYTLVAISLTNPYLVFDHVDVFDTTQVVPGTTDFVKVGQIPLTDQSLFCGPNAPYGCDYFGALLISPLGDTLFWVGNQQLVVTPIPSPMASVASVRMRLLPATTH